MNGHPLFFVEKGGKKMLSFPKIDEPEYREAALRGLLEIAGRRRGKMLTVHEIDGVGAAKHPLYPALKALGYGNAAIAAELGISAKTVEKHLTEIHRRWGVRTRTGGARLVSASPRAGE